MYRLVSPYSRNQIWAFKILENAVPRGPSSISYENSIYPVIRKNQIWYAVNERLRKVNQVEEVVKLVIWKIRKGEMFATVIIEKINKVKLFKYLSTCPDKSIL